MSPAHPTPPDSTPVIHKPTPEGITTITINRPHVRNAVNAATALSLAAAFREFDADPTQKVCILTGAGGNFCAGYDLHELAGTQAGGDSSGSPSRPVTSTSPADGTTAPMGPSRMMLSKPLIAAVEGHAVAGGLELALLADVRIADETAMFGVFCRRFGVPLVDGGTVRLPRVVGLGRAMDMILSGRPVGATEALGMGLVNRVAERGTAMSAALEFARGLLAFPQMCMRADRRSAYHAAFEAGSLEDALRFEYEQGEKVIAEESVKGAARFDKGEGRGGAFGPEKGRL